MGGLTEQQGEAFLGALAGEYPTTKTLLYNYLRGILGVHLACKAIEPGNSSPFDLVWSVYASMMGLREKPCYEYVVIAGRGTQKSLSGAVVETLALLHDKVRDWFHCAAIMDQSERTYGYVRKFVSNEYLLRFIDGDPKMKETVTIYDTRLQIGTGTIKSVSGFHGSVVLDEYDLLERSVAKIAKGMLSAKLGKRPLMVYMSSRYFSSGNVEDLSKQARELDDVEVHKWGILEMTERCPDSWSGTKKTSAYVNDDLLHAMNETDWNRLDVQKQASYTKLPAYENCVKCGIFGFCKGYLKNQMTRLENPYLEPLEETRSKFRTNDLETFLSQRLNRKPSSRDLVYRWDEDVHVISPEKAWEMLTGDAPAMEPTVEDLVGAIIKHGGELNYGADCGYTEAAAGLYGLDGLERIFLLDEITESGLSDAEFAMLIKARWGKHPLSNGYPDQIPSFMKELLKQHLPVSNKVDKSAGSVEAGIEAVRQVLWIPGTRTTRFFCISWCANFRAEMANYKRKIDPRTDLATDHVIKRNDHHPDQFRYFVATRIGKSKTIIRTANVTQPDGPVRKVIAPGLAVPTGAPRPQEIAASIGIQVPPAPPRGDAPDPIRPKKTKLTFSV